MGTSIAMLERHYSHLEVLHRADILAGRAEITRGRVRKVAAKKETEIIQLDDAAVRKTKEAAQAVEAVARSGNTASLRNH
ncbi:MAG: hypothetical protein QY326_06450 [Bdellovibrionota bacterium]|nr:MAG: hypothetical protein QY326_06450 [Bdellovibrionota bacterium]